MWMEPTHLLVIPTGDQSKPWVEPWESKALIPWESLNKATYISWEKRGIGGVGTLRLPWMLPLKFWIIFGPKGQVHQDWLWEWLAMMKCAGKFLVKTQTPMVPMGKFNLLNRSSHYRQTNRQKKTYDGEISTKWCPPPITCSQYNQLMVNCWFGLVVWDSRGTPK